MRRGLAYWIWAFFAICLPLQKAGLFASDPPPASRMSRTTFHVRWHRMLKSVMIIQANRGASQPRLFVTEDGRTGANFADRLLAHTEQASAHTPKKQKNKRCSDWAYNQCIIVVFEMFSGHRSTLGNLSGEPRLWKVLADFPMFVSCDCVANEPWSLGTVPWAESDSVQKQFMGKPRRRWCALCTVIRQGAWQRYLTYPRSR